MDWRRLYAAAMLETNPIVLGHLVNDTEGSIYLRLQELAISSAGPGHGERDDIREATAGLLKLKTDKLGWVDQVVTKIGSVSTAQGILTGELK
jgi:hypothetical protein